MATQIVTLVGVLIGALTSYLATAIAERAKFRRTMTTRWDERKLDTYIEYISCVKEIMRAAREALRARDREEDTTGALAEMEAIEAKRSILFESFILLSNEAAATAAHVVNQQAWDLLRVTRNPANGEAALEEVPLVTALNALHAAARADLAIGRGQPA